MLGSPTLQTDRFGAKCPSRSRFRKTSFPVAYRANPAARVAARTIAFACGRVAVVEDTDCLADSAERFRLLATRLPADWRGTGSPVAESPTKPCVDGASRVAPGEIRTFVH